MDFLGEVFVALLTLLLLVLVVQDMTHMEISKADWKCVELHEPTGRCATYKLQE